MKLKRINKGSSTQVEIGDKVILYSYSTPVAVNYDGKFYRTSKHYSQTTSKHINQWLAGASAEAIEQSELEKLIGDSQ